MTIIAVLFALISAAVVKSMQKMDETRTRNDIQQLANGVQAFKTDFSVSYIPDKLYLPPSADPTGASVQYITTVWPRITSNTAQAPLTNGPYWGAPAGKTIVLQGYQTIVFFLGGAPDPSGSGARLGFSANAIDPMNTSGATGAAARKGPYYDFPPARLQALYSDQQNGNPFPAFIDTYGTMPYLYFSASKAGNDYNATYNIAATPPTPQIGTTSAGTNFAVFPFQISAGTSTASPRFANANGYQIISAGRDTLFHNQGSNLYGGGTLWAGFPGGSTDLAGNDNMANFHPNLLGIAAQ
jgi:hypothetical protein